MMPERVSSGVQQPQRRDVNNNGKPQKLPLKLGLLFLGAFALYNVLVDNEDLSRLEISSKPTTTTSTVVKSVKTTQSLNNYATATTTSSTNGNDDYRHISNNTTNSTVLYRSRINWKAHSITSNNTDENSNTDAPTDASMTVRRKKDRSGHWERDARFTPAYKYSEELCNNTNMNPDDCLKQRACYDQDNLMNWLYYYDNDEDNKTKQPQPRFDADGFRLAMKNKRIHFIGPSMMRQQVTALVWSLGVTKAGPSKRIINGCGLSNCITIDPGNITICFTVFGRPLSKTYQKGNYTLHSNRSAFAQVNCRSCLLEEEYMADFYSSFDVTFVQSLSWWTGMERSLPTAPKEWIKNMIPTIYYDSIKKLLSLLSNVTSGSVYWVLGHTGTSCSEKTKPEPWTEMPPDMYGWRLSEKLWNVSLELLQEPPFQQNIRILDIREPTMESVHAHPSSPKDSKVNDCLHFCIASAALNIYLDVYWTDVFSRFQ